MCCGLAFPRNYLHIIIITLQTNTNTLLTDWVKLSKYEHVTYRLGQTQQIRTRYLQTRSNLANTNTLLTNWVKLSKYKHVTYILGQTEHVTYRRCQTQQIRTRYLQTGSNLANTNTLLTYWVKLSKYEHVTYRLGQTEHVQTPQSSDQLLTTLCPPLLRKELQLYTQYMLINDNHYIGIEYENIFITRVKQFKN